MTGLFRSSTAVLSRTVVLHILALSLLRTTANSLQGPMTRARLSHPRAESHSDGMLQPSKCYHSREGSTGHPGAPDTSGEDYSTTVHGKPPMWPLLYWPLRDRQTSAGLKSLQIRGATDVNGLATQLKPDRGKHHTAKVCDVMKANRGLGLDERRGP